MSRVHAHRDVEMAGPLGFVHGVGDPGELVELALELRPLSSRTRAPRRVPDRASSMSIEMIAARLGRGHVVEDPCVHALGDQQLVVVAKPAMSAPSPPACCRARAELLQRLDDPQELLPVGAAQVLQLTAPHAERS